MGIRRHIRLGAMRPDDRELQARLVHLLNQLQNTNERARGLLLDGNLDGLVTVGRAISDLGVTLMLIAADNGGDVTADQAELFDPRERAAGEHLDTA